MEQLEYKELVMINERLVAENDRLKSDNEKMEQELRVVDVFFSKLEEDIKARRDKLLNESNEQELSVDASSDL